MSATATATGRAPAETRAGFACFGSECTVIVAGAGAHAADAVRVARGKLLEWHRRFSRFERDSELTRLNEDPRSTVPITPLMRRILEAALAAAQRTDGLVDATLIPELERAGYGADLVDSGADAALPLAGALALAPVRAPAAGAGARARWRAVSIDRRAGTVTRPPGVKFDSGGIAKGVFADELATLLSSHDAYVVDCGGDLRLGGRARLPREIQVASPFDDTVLHRFAVAGGAAATSGIGKRRWLSDDGRPAHHLLDPRTGEPAFTGVVQASALAPTATEAEVRSKTAILSGPETGAEILAEHGGVIVLDDGSHRVLRPR